MTEALPAPSETSGLGAQLRGTACHFALWAPRATAVELALVDEDRSQTNHDMSLGADGVWSIEVPDIIPGQRYGYRVHGEWDPHNGARFNPARLLIDPYARAITAGVDYSGPILDHPADDNYTPDVTDSAFAVPLSVVVGDSPAPTPIERRRPLHESVIYETHLKGFTRLHPMVPEHLRGTYQGLAYPAVIDHLKELGVTAIELLPLQHFVSEPFIVGRGLSNYWGYNTLGFFAPHAAYASIGTLGQQVTEFKEMVSRFHEAGIEVILDVVYNHTGEGGHQGPTLSFRGIDHGGYYRLTDDLHNDYDVTGCGNSVDTSEPGVLSMVLDSLRYWVTEMGVDGFRFDLATELIRDENHHVTQDHPFKQLIAQDPVFADIKMIAEPWDMGPYGYQVGAWGSRWSEWNDRFRNYMRDFWRGQVAGVSELATRMSGSPDVFDHSDRLMRSSVNFITAHDGFTLRDLVTYDGKHNEANGEDNRDGADDNRSWNCGIEGETDDPGVLALRHRQVRNMMATLCLANGVPMLTAGDEMGRTQDGNNNAYCQDSPISWVNWTTQEEWNDVFELTAALLRLRAEHPALSPDRFRHEAEILDVDGNGLGRPDLTWFHESGNQMDEGAWNDPGRKSLAMYTSDPDSAFLIWMHAHHEPVEITLPGGSFAKSWTLLLHTAENHELPALEETFEPGAVLTLPQRCVVVFRAEVDSVAPEVSAAAAESEPETGSEPESDGVASVGAQSPDNASAEPGGEQSTGE